MSKTSTFRTTFRPAVQSVTLKLVLPTFTFLDKHEVEKSKVFFTVVR